MPKERTEKDRKLIKELFGYDPLDWARYPGGHLVHISPTGQKFKHAPEYLENLLVEVKQFRNQVKKKFIESDSAPKSKKSKAKAGAAPAGAKKAPDAAPSKSKPIRDDLGKE